MNVFKRLLASRKAWLVVLGLVVAYFGDKLNVDEVALAGALAVIFANIFGIAIEDAAEKKANGKAIAAVGANMKEEGADPR